MHQTDTKSESLQIFENAPFEINGESFELTQLNQVGHILFSYFTLQDFNKMKASSKKFKTIFDLPIKELGKTDYTKKVVLRPERLSLVTRFVEQQAYKVVCPAILNEKGVNQGKYKSPEQQVVAERLK